MIKKVDIEIMVLSVIKSLAEEQELNGLSKPEITTRLFGKTLDSMGIVLLVSELENILFDNFDKTISLADERAMSQKTSPFRSIETLIDYIYLLLNEECM